MSNYTENEQSKKKEKLFIRTGLLCVSCMWECEKYTLSYSVWMVTCLSWWSQRIYRPLNKSVTETFLLVFHTYTWFWEIMPQLKLFFIRSLESPYMCHVMHKGTFWGIIENRLFAYVNGFIFPGSENAHYMTLSEL